MVLLALTGCQQHLLIDLLNESGSLIEAYDESYGHRSLKTVQDMERARLRGTGPLVIRLHGKTLEYSLESSIPPEAIRVGFARRVLFLTIDKAGKLYVLHPSEKPPRTRIEPQPEPFPLIPSTK